MAHRSEAGLDFRLIVACCTAIFCFKASRLECPILTWNLQKVNMKFRGTVQIPQGQSLGSTFAYYLGRELLDDNKQNLDDCVACPALLLRNMTLM